MSPIKGALTRDRAVVLDCTSAADLSAAWVRSHMLAPGAHPLTGRFSCSAR